MDTTYEQAVQAARDASEAFRQFNRDYETGVMRPLDEALDLARQAADL